MEKIREALAKARSDKAFRQQHPVADVGRFEKPIDRESNDTSGPRPDGTTEKGVEASSGQGHDNVSQEQTPDDKVPDTVVGRETGAVGLDSATIDGNFVPDDGPSSGPLIQEPEVPSYRQRSTGRAAVIDIEESADAGPADTDEAASVPAKSQEPARRVRPQKSKPLVIAAVGGLVIGGLVLVHVLLVPLDTVWAALVSGEGNIGEAVGPALEKALRWAEKIVEALVGLLGAPEPS